jgi:hypothetical protein
MSFPKFARRLLVSVLHLRALAFFWTVFLSTAFHAQVWALNGETGEAHAKRFREAFPFHMQTLALSGNKDDTRTLIIAEPPPHVTFDDVKAIDARFFKNATVRKHSIGRDGWVKDIVVVFSAADWTESQLNELLATLGKRLFHTSYKLPILDLDQLDKVKEGRYNLDLRISYSDLERWFLNVTERLKLGHP